MSMNSVCSSSRSADGPHALDMRSTAAASETGALYPKTVITNAHARADSRQRHWRLMKGFVVVVLVGGWVEELRGTQWRAAISTGPPSCRDHVVLWAVTDGYVSVDKGKVRHVG